MSRHLAAIIVILVVLSTLACPAMATYRRVRPKPAAPHDSLRIVTFNAGSAEWLSFDLVPCVKPRRQALLRELRVAAQQLPTLFVLQEVWSEGLRREIVRTLGGVGYRVSTENPRLHGLVVATPGDSLVTDFRPFACDQWSGWGVRRGILVATFTYHGHAFTVLDTHTAYSDLGEPSACQLRNFTDVVSAAQRILQDRDAPTSMTVIVAGDFNTGPDHAMRGQRFDPRRALWANLESAMTHAGFQRATANAGPTWDADHNPLVFDAARIGPKKITWSEVTCTLDHVWVHLGRGERVSRAQRLFDAPVLMVPATCRGETASFLSDHYAVGCSISWPIPPRDARGAD